MSIPSQGQVNYARQAYVDDIGEARKARAAYLADIVTLRARRVRVFANAALHRGKKSPKLLRSYERQKEKTYGAHGSRKHYISAARERDRSKRHYSSVRKARADRPKETKAGAALHWAAEMVGTKESPPNSNRGARIDVWARELGSWLLGQPWCGVFAYQMLKRAGVKGITSRMAGVANIEDDAKAHRNGFTGWGGPQSGGRLDCAIIGGRGVHVEVIDRKTDTGYWTYGGNTSPGDGSVSNGGAVAHKFRPFSAVYGVAHTPVS